MNDYVAGYAEGRADFSRHVLFLLDKEFRRIVDSPEVYSIDKIETLSNITKLVLEARNADSKKDC